MTYSPSIITGGAPPVSVTCTPSSGTAFPIGATAVTCTASDARQRTASCGFTVTVSPPPPRISATRFVAFGDSLTEGTLASGPIATSPYPAALQTMLAADYTAQTIVVLNAGKGHERVLGNDGGLARLPDVLNANNADVLLIMEGVNDLAEGGTISTMVDGLRDMVKEGQRRGMRVLLSTLPPERAGGSRARAAPLIQDANNQIRRVAVLQGATLVDVYDGLGGVADPWIGEDGLHPNEMGYARIAEIFFTVIRAQFEIAQASQAAAGIRPARSAGVVR